MAKLQVVGYQLQNYNPSLDTRSKVTVLSVSVYLKAPGTNPCTQKFPQHLEAVTAPTEQVRHPVAI